MRHFVCLIAAFLPALLSAQIEIDILRTNVSCFGICNGSATATGSGGTAPYSYHWSNGVNAATVNGLCTGVYTVTVTDANQSSAVDSVMITQPLLPLSVTVTVTPQICDIAPDGTAIAEAQGGTPPYSYQWSNGSANDTIRGLAQGTYTVTVTDLLGCTTVGQDSVPFWPEGIWLMIVPKDLRCFGDSSGAVHVGPMTGTAPYRYYWSTGDSLTQDITHLGPGTYTVTVYDANGCSNTASANVTGPPILDIDLFATPAFCGDPGSATVVPSGGTQPYTIHWSNGSADTMVFVPAGQISVTVTDADSCTVIAGITIPGNNDSLTITGQVLSNAGCTIGGSATVQVSGGSGSYSYIWSTPNADSTLTIINLAAGTYTVTVSDDSTGCTGTASVVVPLAPVLTINAGITSQATCVTGATVTVSVTGGTPPFKLVWSNGDSTSTVTGLVPATYIVMVTDSTGCTALDTVDILPPPPPTAAATVLTQATCVALGTAQATPAGGTPPFSYLWDSPTGPTTPVASLAPGIHTVTVTDAAQCTATATVTLAQPPLPNVATQLDHLANCLGGGGGATANASGGTAPYQYAWSGIPDTTASITNKPAGIYTVTLTDAGGCTATSSITIPQSVPPVVTTQMNSPANCLGGGGAATATVTGDTPPFKYSWSSGANDTTATITNKVAGIYTVTVTDAAGCTATSSVTILQSPPPSVTTQATSLANCIGGGGCATATATGGTPPYQYAWSGLIDITAGICNKPAGTYTVTVTDAAGCTATSSVTILQSPPPSLNTAVTTPVTCTSTGTATATASGGTPPYAYQWLNGPSTPVYAGLAPGTYIVLVTDAASCTAEKAVTLAAPPTPIVSIIDSVHATCNTLGSATASASGGTAPYSYLWDNSSTNAMATNLAIGIHKVTVTDAAGCSGTASVTIKLIGNGIKVGDYVWFDNDQDGFQHPLEKGAPNIKVVLFNAGADNLFGTADDVKVDSTATDSTGKYAFACITPDTFVLAYSVLPAGYEFTAKDKVNNDCKDSDVKANGKTDPFVVLPNQGDNLCMDAGIHVICDNVTYAGWICCDQTICEGEIPELLHGTLQPYGGSGPLEYVWMQLIQLGPGLPTWAAVPGANQPTYQPGPLFETSCFMRCVRRQGCVTFLESNIVKITVLPANSPGCDPFAGNFTVSALSAATVMVQWTTPPEIARYLYIAERSADKEQWTAVEQMTGYQDAAAPNHYTVMDHTPVSGMNYYRIRRLSAGGSESLSEVREVEINIPLEKSLAVYPNPVSQVLHIRNLMAYDSDARVDLFTVSGHLLYSVNIRAGTQQSFDVPTGQLPQGIYLVRLRLGKGNVNTVKVSKL